jgi:hypothetical protein
MQGPSRTSICLADSVVMLQRDREVGTSSATDWFLIFLAIQVFTEYLSPPDARPRSEERGRTGVLACLTLVCFLPGDWHGPMVGTGGQDICLQVAVPKMIFVTPAHFHPCFPYLPPGTWHLHCCQLLCMSWVLASFAMLDLLLKFLHSSSILQKFDGNSRGQIFSPPHTLYHLFFFIIISVGLG